MKKKILLIAATHGDEKIGIEVINNLKDKGLNKYFDCLIANTMALDKNVRFVEVDLNRSYPGSRESLLYEERRAYENLILAQNYRYVIDIHEASQGINNFIIVPKERLSESFPIDLIDMGTVLLWPDPKGPLGQVVENAIELEFGMKNRNRKKVILKAENVIKNFIKYVYGQKPKERSVPKKLYYVYGKLMQSEFNGDISQIKDFKKAEINSEQFYPLLVGQYLKSGIICYKMKLFG